MALNLLAVTSYEAAVGVPLLLFLLYLGIARRPRPLRERLTVAGGLAAAWPVLAALSAWNHRGVTAPETCVHPSALGVWAAARYDFANYVLKALGLIHPGDPWGYDLYNEMGASRVSIVVLLVLVLLVWWMLRRPTARFGLAIFAILLAPPFLVRISVGSMNTPTLRQLYLPLLGLSSLVGAIRWRAVWTVTAGALAVAAMIANWSVSQNLVGRPRMAYASELAKRASAPHEQDVNALDPLLLQGRGIGERRVHAHRPQIRKQL